MAATAGKQRRRPKAYPAPWPGPETSKEMESRSLVEICGTYRTKCGYCKRNTKTSVSYGLLAKRLTCADYQDLIDRGWRRSGTFVYKPVMHETCCPQYTIRLDATRFKHTKAQRHVLNRLRRYLDGDRESRSSATGSQDASLGRKDPSSAGSGKAGARGKKKERGVSRDSPRGNDVLADGSATRASSESLNPLSQRVVTAALSAVEGGAVPGLSLRPEWRSQLAGWSQVRPARNKKMFPAGGGFCSAVALSIASAARKQGWKGVGASGGAFAIAEAIAERLRAGGSESTEPAVLSSIAVAPNGFINFGASCVSPCSLASKNSAQQPLPRPQAASAGGPPTPPANPPPPPAQGSSLSGDTPAGGGVSSSERGSTADAAPTFPKPASMQEKREGVRGSLIGSTTTGAFADRPEQMLAAPGKEAVLSTGIPWAGKRETTVGQGGGGSSTPVEAVAQMKWVEKQGNNDGMMDVEASSAAQSGGANLETPGSDPRTGLSSLPPLSPGVEPHRMTVSTVPARLTDEVFRLYVKYQVSVHGDEPSEVTPDQFCRFLVDSPLIRETIGGTIVRQRKPAPRRETASRSAWPVEDDAMELAAEDELSEMTQGQDSLSVPYGSYHQLYRIDGRLIAVGVVDILPKCLSSVYCFYDPDYRALALGKLTALKETDFVKEAHAIRPALRDYYMGFYIHTCPKMSYKGSYTPSSLLCPERLTWVPLELCRPVLDVHKYARLSDLLLTSQPPHAPLEGAAEESNGKRSGGSNGTVRVRGPDGSMGRPGAAGISDRGHSAGPEGTGASPATRQTLPGSGSQSPLSSLSPDRREVGHGRSREVLASSRARSVPGGGSGRRPFGGDGSNDRTTEAGAAMAARRAASERAAAARAARAAEDAASGINDIPLMVGHPAFLVKLPELTPQSQALVRDVLSSYVATMGSDLAMRIVLKLHD